LGFHSVEAPNYPGIPPCRIQERGTAALELPKGLGYVERVIGNSGTAWKKGHGSVLFPLAAGKAGRRARRMQGYC
jgi:hypothetical protein